MGWNMTLLPVLEGPSESHAAVAVACSGDFGTNKETDDRISPASILHFP